MATLTRTRPSMDTSSFEEEADGVIQRRLQLEIPKPFPDRRELEQQEELEALANEELTLEVEPQPNFTRRATSGDRDDKVPKSTSQDAIAQLETLDDFCDRHTEVNISPWLFREFS